MDRKIFCLVCSKICNANQHIYRDKFQIRYLAMKCVFDKNNHSANKISIEDTHAHSKAKCFISNLALKQSLSFNHLSKFRKDESFYPSILKSKSSNNKIPRRVRSTTSSRCSSYIILLFIQSTLFTLHR